MGSDGGLSTLCHSCRFTCQQRNVSWLWLSLLRGWGSLTIAFTGKFVRYIYTIYSFIIQFIQYIGI